MDLQAWKARARVLYKEDNYEEIWESDLRLEEKLEVLFDLFEETGSSYILTDIWINRQDREEEFVVHYMLTKYRKYLSGDDKFLEQLAKEHLWYDMFEDPKWQREAWSYMLKEPWNDQRIRNLLEMSGPAPYDLKRRLYDELLPDKKWHVPIARSIYHSIIDYYGNVDWEDAQKMFNKLTFPEKLDSDDSAIINFLRSKRHAKLPSDQPERARTRYRWVRDAPKRPRITNMSFYREKSERMPRSIAVTFDNVGATPITIDEVWVNDVKQTSTEIILPKTIAVGEQVTIRFQYDWQMEKYYDVKLVSSEGLKYVFTRAATETPQVNIRRDGGVS